MSIPPPTATPSADKAPASTIRRTLRILLAVVAVGLLARAPRLAESLWYDEIAAWRDYGTRGPWTIVSTYYDPANHVAHTLLTWASVTALGDALGSEFALRVPALLFSLAVIPVMYRLGRVALDARAGLVAAALAAVLPVCVLEGADARGYSMMIFFSAASTWCMASIAETRGGWRLPIYAATCAFGIWAHPVSVFVPIGHAAWLAWRLIRFREIDVARRTGTGLVLAALLTAALYAPIASDMLHIRGSFTRSGGNAPNPLGIEGLHALLQLGGAWSWWAALPGLALLAIGAVSVAGAPQARRIAALSLLGLPALVATALIAGWWMYARFTLFAVPGAVLLMAVGIDALWRRRRVAALAALGVVLAAALADLALRPPRQPLRDAAAFVAASRAADERVLVIGLRHQVLDVYAEPLEPAYSLFHGRDLAAKLNAVDPTWVIMLYPQNVGADARHLLEARGFEVRERLPGWIDWGNGEIVVMARNAR